MNIKNIIIFFIALLSPSLLLAADIKTDDKVTVSEDLENLYSLSQEFENKKDISGDAIIIAQNIIINKKIERNLSAIGININISSEIGANARLAGQEITLAGPVGEDLLILADSVNIEKANIGGDLWISANQVNINDTNIEEDVNIFSKEVIFNGTVNGNAKIHTSNLVIGNNAKVNGSLVYWSEKEGSIDPNSQIKNGPYFNQTQRAQFNKISNLTYAVISLIALALAVSYIFKKQLGQAQGIQILDFAKDVCWGLLYLTLLPILFLIILTISPHLSLALFALYIILLLIAYGFSAIYTGVLIQKAITKDKHQQIDWTTIIIGSFIFLITGLIPFVGQGIKFMIILFSFGFIINKLYFLIKMQRSAKTKGSK